jgi:glutamate N-acetyltransferase/amino-acid N-acetyltransferase
MSFRETKHGVCTPGFSAAGVRRGRYGVALVVAERVCETAAVFTRNNVKAAPVKYTKKVVGNGVQAVVANSGNANCFVPDGMKDAKAMAAQAARVLGVDKKHVAVSSTGIIGRRMDIAAVRGLIMEAGGKLASNPRGSLQAAKAIMTTDKRIKMFSASYKGIHVGGICKGAGMIAPDMATMLCYITTNARIPRVKLQSALRKAVDDSFNLVSVEGDMSTNDTVLLLSNMSHKCGLKDFRGVLEHVTCELAKMIARDGEGATKFIEVQVKGAKSVRDARRGVKAIINSPLVKTAFYGENPNWGRIAAALGSVVKVEEGKVDITLQSDKKTARVVKAGRPMKPEAARKVMAKRNIKVIVDLGGGGYSAVGWGCDLTPEYVRINAGYS